AVEPHVDRVRSAGGKRQPREDGSDRLQARMSGGRRQHRAERRRIEQRDDAELEQAEVVAKRRGGGSGPGLRSDCAHAGLLSTARCANAGRESERGSVSTASESMPAHTKVAIATCRPLKAA